MKITIQVLIEGNDALPLTVPIHTIDRLCERIEEVGLQTVEAKSILRGLEDSVVRHQLAECLAGKRSCPHCQRSRAIKGYHPLRFRSAYRDVSLRSPRWHRCECERSTEATYCPLNDLLTSHTTPELEFLLAKWAAHFVDINNCRPLFSASGHHRCINVVARNLLISNPVLAE